MTKYCTECGEDVDVGYSHDSTGSDILHCNQCGRVLQRPGSQFGFGLAVSRVEEACLDAASAAHQSESDRFGLAATLFELWAHTCAKMAADVDPDGSREDVQEIGEYVRRNVDRVEHD